MVYEGAFASRNPYSCLAGNYAAGPTDIAMGRFGWGDPGPATVSNVQTPKTNLGLIVPRFGLWSAVYLQAGVWYLRKGKPVTLAVKGDFWVRFPYGAIAGCPVYADPATGIAYAADGGGFALTNWQAVTDAPAGGLAIISPYTHYFGGI